jgi:hypothetical protein
MIQINDERDIHNAFNGHGCGREDDGKAWNICIVVFCASNLAINPLGIIAK